MSISKPSLVLLLLFAVSICGCWYGQFVEAMFSKPLPERLTVKVTPVSSQTRKDGLDPQQLRLAVAQAFSNCGVEIVEPNLPDSSCSTLLIHLDVQDDPSTQTYSCKVELRLFDPSTVSEQQVEPNFRVAFEPTTGVSSSDMPQTVRDKLAWTLLMLMMLYPSDEDKDEFIGRLMEGYYSHLGHKPPQVPPDCPSKALKDKPRADTGM